MFSELIINLIHSLVIEYNLSKLCFRNYLKNVAISLCLVTKTFGNKLYIFEQIKWKLF